MIISRRRSNMLELTAQLATFLSISMFHMAWSQDKLPSIKIGPSNIEISRGSNMQLPCASTGDPKPIITWYKDGEPVSLGGKVKQLEDDSLFFDKVRRSSRRSDAGVYWCVAKNVNGEARSMNATVTVTYISRRFKINPQSTDASLLSFIQLDCQPPDAFPGVTVAWKKNSKAISTDNRIRTQSLGYVYHLKISSALQQDTGNYTCVASNKAGSRVSRIAVVRVLVPPSVSVTQSKITVYEQDKVDMSCLTTGVPQPTVKWYKKDGELPLPGRMRRLSPNRIQITSAELSDAGVFTCRAVNSEGITEANVTLVVKMLPKFLARPGNLKVGIGQDARFECKVQAEPGYKILWQQVNGAQIFILSKGQSGKRVTVHDDGTLLIKNVQKKDEASYICTVISSDEKTESASARLTVVQSTVPLPEVTLIPLNQTIFEGADFNLTCIAKGTPKPTVSWQSASSNQKMTKQTEGVVIEDYGFVHSLILKSVKIPDSGSYRCIASNSDRVVSKVAYLTVLPVPKIPEPPDYIDHVNVTYASVILKWKASRDPPGAPVTSYIVSIYDEKGRLWKALASNVKQLQYTVRNLKPNSRYEFRVSAVNKAGRSAPSKSTKVIVTKAKDNVKPTSLPATKATPKFVDMLLNVSITVTVSSSPRADWYNIFWNSVHPPSRVKEYEIYWKKKSDMKFNPPKRVFGGESNSYVLKGLDPATQYEVKVRALNDRYGSSFSNVKSFSTLTKQEVNIPPPNNVRVKVNDTGKVLVTWTPPNIKGLSGFEIVWIAMDGTSVATKTVPANATSYLIAGLNPNKAYHVTLALKVDDRSGLKSDKLQIVPSLGKQSKNQNGKELGTKSGVGGASDKRSDKDGQGSSTRKNKDSGIIKLLKTPWFIGAVLGFLWVVICIIILVVVLKRRKKRSIPPFHAEQTNGLLPTRSPVNSMSRAGASYRDSSFFWGETEAVPSTVDAPPTYRSLAGANASVLSRKRPSISEESNMKPEIKPLLGNRNEEFIEMRTRAANGDSQKNMKNANNLRRPGDCGSISSGNKETFLNNLKKDRSIDRYAASPKLNLNRNVENSLDRPRFKIQGAFDGQKRSKTADEKDENDEVAKQNNMLERHAEIVRTSNKKFDSDLVNCLENNPQATWKREKMKDAPEVLVSGEDTLRRKAKQFKPLPKLEVLNWADDRVTPSKAGSSAGSPPSSPKTSASTFSDNNGSRATSRASQGSMSSLNKYPYGGRSGQAPSISSRRMSQSSSMVSSELYQSEMDPSVYSDATSEKKKPKGKAVPPPIDLDGLTSDILLQWAESVTNSSPSSSGSSSPSRLSAISSDGSFLTDEDFAQAVAAVVECGGFMDFDYSLSNMPGLQVSSQNQNRPTPTDRSHKAKMDKIDAMIASKSKSSRHGAGSSISQQNRARQDTCSPPSVPPLSFSSYLTGNSKRGGANSLSGITPNGNNRQRANNHSVPCDPQASRFGNGEADAFLTTPLTMSNLRQHDSSLGREKKHAKPLTVSNLRQHDSSLDRQKKSTVESLPVADDDVFAAQANGDAVNGTVAKPLSVISALERNESLGSTKDSKSSVNSEIEGRNTSERRKEKKYVVNLKDPTSSTGTSTASTVRTSQDQTEC